MARVVETKLLLTGEDRGAAKTFERIEGAVRRAEKAFDGLARVDKVAGAVDRVGKAMDRVAETDRLRTELAANAKAMDVVGKASGRMGAQVSKDVDKIARTVDRAGKAFSLSDKLQREMKAMNLTRAEIGKLARDAARMTAEAEKALGGIGNEKVRAQIVAAERANMQARLLERAKGLSEARQLEERFSRELGGFYKAREGAFRDHHTRMGAVLRTSAAYMGAGGAIYMGGRLVRGAATAGADAAREKSRDYLAGLSDKDSKRIEQRSFELSSRYRSIEATTAHERLRDTAMSMGSTDKALAMSDAIGRSTTVLQALKGPEAAIEQGRRFFSALDVLGKNIDPKEVETLLDGYIKALGVEGADLDLGNVLEFAKQSRSAGGGLNNRFLMSSAPALMMDLGGPALGTSLQTAISQVIGGRATKQTKAYQEELGLRDHKGKFLNRDMLVRDPFEYSEKILLPALKKHGIDTSNDAAVIEAMSKLFSKNTVSDVFTKLITQRDQYIRKAGQYDQAPGLAAADELAKKDPYVARAEAIAQWNNAMAELTKTVMPAATDALRGFASGMNTFAEFARENPLTALGGAALGTGAAVYGGKKALDALDMFGLKGSAGALTTSAGLLDKAAIKLMGGSAIDVGGDGGADKKDRKGRRPGGRSFLGGLTGAIVGGFAANELVEMLGDENEWLANAAGGAGALAGMFAPIPTVGAAVAATASEAAAKADPSGITNEVASDPMLMTGGAGLAGRIAALTGEHLAKSARDKAAIAAEDPRDLAALRRDQDTLRKRLDAIPADRAAVPGGESMADLDALEAEIKGELQKIASLIVRRSGDAGLVAFDALPSPTRSFGYRGVPSPPMRPALEEALKDARPVGEEAGRQAGEGVAEGIQSKAPQLRSQTMDVLKFLQDVVSLNPIRIPMSLAPSGLGGLGGGGGGGGLFRASYGGAGGSAGSIGSAGDLGGRGSHPMLSRPGVMDAIGGRSGGVSRGPSTAQGRDNVQSWLSFLERPQEQGGMGLEPDKARAMVAMLQGESGPNLNHGAIGDSKTSIGAAQWRDPTPGRGRATDLKRFAARRGTHWTDVETQQQNFKREMDGPYRKTMERIRGARTAEEALEHGVREFERPKYPGREAVGRRRHLERLRRDAERAPPPAAVAPPVAPPPRPSAPPVFDAERLNVLNEYGGGGFRSAVDRMNEVVTRMEQSRFAGLVQVELSGLGRDQARVKGMKATSEGSMRANMGVTMPHVRLPRAV